MCEGLIESNCNSIQNQLSILCSELRIFTNLQTGISGFHSPLLHRIFRFGKLRSNPLGQYTLSTEPRVCVALLSLMSLPALMTSISMFGSVIGSQSLLSSLDLRCLAPNSIRGRLNAYFYQVFISLKWVPGVSHHSIPNISGFAYWYPNYLGRWLWILMRSFKKCE